MTDKNYGARDFLRALLANQTRPVVGQLVRERVPRTPSSSTSVAELGRLAHRAAQFFSDRERTP